METIESSEDARMDSATETGRQAPEPVIRALERRIERSERRAKAAMLLAATGVGTTLFAATTRPGLSDRRQSVLYAPYRVVDVRGRPLLSVDSNQVVVSAPLFLRNPAGREVASLVARPQGGVLCVNDRTGDPVACLGPSDLPGWGPQLIFFSKPGIQALHLSGGREGGAVAVYDGQEPRAPAGELSSRGGAGSLLLRGKDEQVLFAKP
jgi:hypothetical protein